MEWRTQGNRPGFEDDFARGIVGVMKRQDPAASATTSDQDPAVLAHQAEELDFAQESQEACYERSQRALKTLWAYKGFLGESGPAHDPETIGDLLTDLHHFLRQQGDKAPGETLADLLRSAGNNFESEITPDSHEIAFLAGRR